jgi:hypothetical protein
MTVIGSDGLSLLVGDGATTEVYNPLKGCELTRLEINQRAHVTNAVASDAWQAQAGTSARHMVIECEAYATDEAASMRVRSLALAGTPGNFKLQLRPTESLQLSAYVTQYREIIGAGEIKKIQWRLESSGAASLV